MPTWGWAMAILVVFVVLLLVWVLCGMASSEDARLEEMARERRQREWREPGDD